MADVISLKDRQRKPTKERSWLTITVGNPLEVSVSEALRIGADLAAQRWGDLPGAVIEVSAEPIEE